MSNIPHIDSILNRKPGPGEILTVEPGTVQPLYPQQPDKYGIEELERDIAWITENVLKPIRKDRGARYGSPNDTLDNVAALDFVTAIGSVVECTNRLKNSVRKRFRDGTPFQFADLENASLDLINYAFYTYILIQRFQKEQGYVQEG